MATPENALVEKYFESLNRLFQGDVRSLGLYELSNRVSSELAELRALARTLDRHVAIDFIDQMELSFQLEMIPLISNPNSPLLEAEWPSLINFFAACTRHVRSVLLAKGPTTPNALEGKNPQKRKVLIIDDSQTYRLLLGKILNQHSDLQVVASAPDPILAEELVAQWNPDVITLDIHMPKMDGFTFLAKLMENHPIPTVLVSDTIDENSGGKVFDSLYHGALDFIPKSKISMESEVMRELLDRIYNASQCKLRRLIQFYKNPRQQSEGLKVDTSKVLAIGAPIGSTRLLVDTLRFMPKDTPPIVIVQNIVPTFSKVLIRELHEICPFVVKEAEDGELLEPMKAVIAPQGLHLFIEPSAPGGPGNKNGGMRVRLIEGDPVNGQKPSVDTMFNSLAFTEGKNVVALLLSGQDMDGTAGLLEVRRAGGITVIQDDPDSSALSSNEAIRIEAACHAIKSSHLPATIQNLISVRKTTPGTDQAQETPMFIDQSPKLLVVDDSPTIRAITRHHLREIGLTQITEAGDGQSAWNILTQAIKNDTPFDLVISDFVMPGLNGQELLKKVRAHEKLKDLPFILATSLADRKTVLGAKEEGVTGYVTKPISTQALTGKILKILAAKGENTKN